jgi:hypothetical protein
VTPSLNACSEYVDELSRGGFALHWLHPKDKRPIGNDWSTKPVATPEQLKRSYAPGNNLGVRLGEVSRLLCGGYLHVIDVDIRNPKYAAEAMAVLDELFRGIAASVPSVISGSGGASRHYYFVTDKPFPSKKLARSSGFDMVHDEKLGREVKKRHWEIELFGTGKQVAMPPSIHPDTGLPYRWDQPFNLEELALGLSPRIPAARLEELGMLDLQTATETLELKPPLGLTEDEAQAILDDLPLEEYCEDYEGWLRVGMALHHEFGGDGVGFELWKGFSQHSDKFNGRKLRFKWNGFRDKPGGVTMASLKKAANDARLCGAFDDIDDELDNEIEAIIGAPVDDTTPQKKSLIDELNEKHAVAAVQGKTVILWENPNGAVSYGSAADLHTFYENERVTSQGGKSTEPITKAWMRHSKRRSYPNGIVFAPKGATAGAYNLWKGFAVEPDSSGSCELFLSHLRDVVCARDPAAYEWLIRWFAHMVQRPWEKPGTAVVLKGIKGTGKDTIGEYIGELFPRHYTKISNPEHFYGRFNAHQEKTLLLHVEEGFWAGDRKAEGQLKHVITSEQILIEPKGVNAFQVASYLRVFISSNEEWVVPATFDERRFFVMNVPPDKAQDERYFTALRHEMRSGGPAALLHHHQSLDLNGFNVRKPPMTEGLRDQKLESLKNIDRWWYECLLEGDLSDPMGFDELDWQTSPVRIFRESLRGSYRDWLRKQRYQGSEVDGGRFGRDMRRLIPSLSNVRTGSDGSRQNTYEIPPLPLCRAEFERALGLSAFGQDSDAPLKDDVADLIG